MFNYGLVCGGVALVAAVISAFLTEVSIGTSWRFGILDRPGTRKIHQAPVPLLGGAAIFASFVVTLALGLLAAWAMAHASESEAQWLPAQLMEACRTLPIGRLAIVVAGAAVMFAVGLADDLRQLSPWTRLAAEVAVAAGIVAAGVRPQTALYGLDPLLLDALAVLWIVGIVNAMNLIDGADGLGGGIAFIASFGCCLEMLIINQPLAGLLLAVLAGVCAGFLALNVPPAKIFMGSSGAQFLGFMLAVGCLQGSQLMFTTHPRFVIAFPFLMLAVPLYDTATVVLLRLRRGHPLFKGDRRHLHHRLIRCGFGRARAVMYLWLAALAIMASALAVHVLVPTTRAAMLLTGGTLAGVFGTLEVAAYVRLRRRIRDRRRRRQVLVAARGLGLGTAR